LQQKGTFSDSRSFLPAERIRLTIEKGIYDTPNAFWCAKRGNAEVTLLSGPDDAGPPKGVAIATTDVDCQSSLGQQEQRGQQQAERRDLSAASERVMRENADIGSAPRPTTGLAKGRS
jgi:hypothetical protein